MARPRTIVYVDGFNLYYGALRGGPNKWLNIERLFRLIRQADDVQKIQYFTAIVDGPGRSRQLEYLRAVQTLGSVELTLGKFKKKRALCRVQACTYRGNRLFQKSEEKRTDVNIGIHMVDDAYRDACDNLVVVTGDSDLVPAVHMVKQRFPKKKVLVYVPARDATRGAAVELRGAADVHRNLPNNLLKHSQFPVTLADGTGGTISKPSSW